MRDVTQDDLAGAEERHAPLADDFLCGVAEDRLGAIVEGLDAALHVARDDADGLLVRLELLRCGSDGLGHVFQG